MDTTGLRINKNMPRADNELNDFPPDFPNGWIPVLEMREIKNNEIKNIRIFGHQLVVFKGNSSKTYVLNAFCPHLGANLGVGGEVIDENGDECIKCPFHGWSFRGDDGLCVKIPELNISEIPTARVKVWQSMVVNEILFVWYHSEDLNPNWFPKNIVEIQNKTWIYRGRTEHTIQCHCQTIPENVPDVCHFSVVHRKGILWKLYHNEWSYERTTSDDETHTSVMEVYTKHVFLGFPFVQIHLTIRQNGPCFAEFRYLTKVSGFKELSGFMYQLVMPIGPNLTKAIMVNYNEPTLLGKVCGKLFLLGSYQAIQEDALIFNNRTYDIKSTIFSKRDKYLVNFRRWFRQFYSGNENISKP